MAANFRNRISLQPNEKLSHGIKWGWGGFFSSCVWCGEWTVHFPLGQWTLNFQCKLGGGGRGGSQLPDMLPKEFPIGPHFGILSFTSLEEDDLVWFISIRSWEGVHNFFFFIRKELYWLAHQQVFWTLGIPQIEAPLWTPSCKKKKNKYAPLDFTFSVYIHGSWTSGKPYGIKPRCKLGTLWGKCIWEHFGRLGTWWEHIEKMRKKNRKSLSPCPLLKEKTRPLGTLAMNQKILMTKV